MPQESSSPNMSNSNGRDRLDVMLHEYRAAQDSAHHYNGLLWQVISIFAAANAVLVGIGLSVYHPGAKLSFSRFLLVLGMAILGGLLNGFAWACTEVFRKFQGDKYDRCKKIEREITFASGQQMKLHTGHKDTRISQKCFYRIILVISVLFWVGFAVAILVDHLCFVEGFG